LFKRTQDHEGLTLSMSGAATAPYVNSAINEFHATLNSNAKTVTIDLGDVDNIDARFLGLLLMLRKELMAQGVHLELIGASGSIDRILRLNGLEFLLTSR
jgi:N-acetylglucosaminyldiphosphoundecaprenol N-acetyl-beta-D-mannosaminyltransferase